MSTLISMERTGLAPGIRALSTHDEAGVEREYLLSVPSASVESIAVVFHPFGSTPELVIYGEEPGDYLISGLDGVARAADALGMLVIAPRSRGRKLEAVSLAWQAHLDAAWELAVRIRDETPAQRIVTGGLSMGGLEALVFAGQHSDEVAAVWAVNPIVDLAEWYEDIAEQRTAPSLWKTAVHDLIAEEVGGTPDQDLEQYQTRSATRYAKGLARTRVRLTWSPADTIIPNQATLHTGPLASRLRALGGDVTENCVTHFSVDPALEAGRFAHEYCDVWENVAWAAGQEPDTSTGDGVAPVGGEA